MKKLNYKKLTDRELKEVLVDLKIQLMQSHATLVEGKKKYNSKNIRKEIARLLTEQRRRK